MSRSTFLGLVVALPIALLAVTVAVFSFRSAGGVATAANAAAAAPNPNCTLIVPANPLSAAGLATPYQLTATNAGNGACHEANVNQSAFVEAAVITPGGQLSLYDPLVIDQGTKPAANPVPAQVPAGSTVGIWFGFNGTTLTLQSANNSLAQGNCVNGLQGSVFGQFAYCNGRAFFQAANQAIAAKTLVVPPLGTATDGKPCPTVRDFSVVDQDQSDNVVTHYLANGNGQIAQKNNANTAALGANVTDLANGSDNLLLTAFIDPALGCKPFTAPDQSSDMQPSSALPLDELSAAAGQQAPIALVPMNDPMVLVNNNASATKTNAYRAGVNQAPIGTAAGGNGSGTTYCSTLFTNAAGIQRVFADQAMFANAPSVDAAMATNLFTFLAMRANQSFTNLGCGNLLKIANPITLTMNGNQVVTAATFAMAGQGGAPCPTPTTTTAAGGTTSAAAGAGSTTSAPATTTSAMTSAAAGGTTTTAAGGASSTTASSAGGAGVTTTAGGTSSSPASTTGTCVPVTSTTAPSTTTGGTTRTNRPPNLWWLHHRHSW